MRPWILILLVALAGCSNKNGTALQGYVEGDYLNIGPQVAGRIVEMPVAEGSTVGQGALLFRIDAAEADAIQAQAQATYDAAAVEFERQKDLRKRKVASQSAFDQAQRNAQTARAALDQAIWQVQQRTIDAPRAGRVEDLFFRVGEVVGAGQAVLALLPPESKKVRFFVPEPQLSQVALGSELRVGCDACPADLKARVTFVSQNAEFTPPVIFSRERREKLIYAVEATPIGNAQALKVGQPVDVELPRP